MWRARSAASRMAAIAASESALNSSTKCGIAGSREKASRQGRDRVDQPIEHRGGLDPIKHECVRRFLQPVVPVDGAAAAERSIGLDLDEAIAARKQVRPKQKRDDARIVHRMHVATQSSWPW